MPWAAAILAWPAMGIIRWPVRAAWVFIRSIHVAGISTVTRRLLIVRDTTTSPVVGAPSLTFPGQGGSIMTGRGRMAPGGRNAIVLKTRQTTLYIEGAAVPWLKT
ncbi:hypothetical protein GCM10022224_101750 [Nonomuraea antimicrobica]|uniref:Secreted protein n=1 Tax=Nonomuraea antimicrobica TaxID=561173 RepID=A0ABP7EIR3_9ACTN